MRCCIAIYHGSVRSSHYLLPSRVRLPSADRGNIMAASLVVQFVDTPAPGDPNQEAVRSAVATAFNE